MSDPATPQVAKPNKPRPEDFDIGALLGEGTFAKVYLATHRSTGKRYAMKIVDKDFVQKHDKVATVINERNVLQALAGHPGVPRLYYTFQDPYSLYYVLDLAPGGELLDALQSQPTGAFPPDVARRLAAELCEIICYIHAKGIAHRDVKPSNILIGADGHVILTDFGTSKQLSAKDIAAEAAVAAQEAATSPDDSDPVSSAAPEADHAFEDLVVEEIAEGASAEFYRRRGRDISFVGTAQYVPPEMLRGSPVGRPGDWWAFGIVLYQLLTGRVPFEGASEYLTFRAILTHSLSFPPGFDPAAEDLIRRLLAPAPRDRLGASPGDGVDKIAHHEYFAPYTTPATSAVAAEAGPWASQLGPLLRQQPDQEHRQLLMAGSPHIPAAPAAATAPAAAAPTSPRKALPPLPTSATGAGSASATGAGSTPPPGSNPPLSVSPGAGAIATAACPVLPVSPRSPPPPSRALTRALSANPDAAATAATPRAAASSASAAASASVTAAAAAVAVEASAHSRAAVEAAIRAAPAPPAIGARLRAVLGPISKAGRWNVFRRRSRMLVLLTELAADDAAAAAAAAAPASPLAGVAGAPVSSPSHSNSNSNGGSSSSSSRGVGNCVVLAYLDTSDPAAPVLKGTIPLTGPDADAYAGKGDTLHIKSPGRVWDIEPLSAPEVVDVAVAASSATFTVAAAAGNSTEAGSAKEQWLKAVGGVMAELRQKHGNWCGHLM